LSTCTEMSDATMDLMIKYNAYYIPTLSAWVLAEKALIPNYYPVLKSLKHWRLKNKPISQKAYKVWSANWLKTDEALMERMRKEFIYMCKR
jgi:hypothetical protein